MHSATRRAATALNAMNEHGEYFVAALKKNGLPLCKQRTQIPEVRDQVVDLVSDRCRDVWRRGFLRL